MSSHMFYDYRTEFLRDAQWKMLHTDISMLGSLDMHRG